MLSWKPVCTCRVVLITLPNCGDWICSVTACVWVWTEQLRKCAHQDKTRMRMHAYTPSPLKANQVKVFIIASRHSCLGMRAQVLVAGCNNLSGEVLLAGFSPAANQLPAGCYKDVGGAPVFGTGSPWQEATRAECCCCWHQWLCVWENLWVKVRSGDWQPESCRSVFLLTSFPEPPTLSLSVAIPDRIISPPIC